jgi:hypothetical protein
VDFPTKINDYQTYVEEAAEPEEKVNSRSEIRQGQCSQGKLALM